MTGVRSQRSMKRGFSFEPVCNELRLFSREASAQVCAFTSPFPASVSDKEMFQQLTSRTNYSEVIPMLFSHVSTSGGHPVIGIFVRRMPNPWPP
jgi:hypothetical protein